jgi:hypothetical protein
MVGPTGGMLMSADGTVKLEIPAGAVAADTMFTITLATMAPAGVVGRAYELGPDGYKFAVPVVLTLPYDVASWTPASDLTIATAVGDHWQPMLSVIDEEGGAHAAISHLSIWGIIPKANNVCQNDVKCGRECCTKLEGAFRGDEGIMTCSGAPFFGYMSCYTECVGGDRVQNFGSGCLRDCCVGNHGAVNDTGNCILTKGIDVRATLLCARGCFDKDRETTVCFPPQRGYCTACPKLQGRTCTSSGSSCTITERLEEMTKTTPGKCQGFGNGCGECVEECDDIETCGNQRDDDCNGLIDDGCVARRCTIATQCPTGQNCTRGYCAPCHVDPNAACTRSGAACTIKSSDVEKPDMMTPGKCEGYGNGCGTCREQCDDVEHCGNGEDDDCNGAIDDGCEARRCTIAAQCPSGQDCRGGYCTACNDSPDEACTSSGGACSIKMNDGPEGMPVTIPGKCMGYGNRCGTCQEMCHVVETCGNGRDDDCNGTIDDGCAARRCKVAAQCLSGQNCRDGYCTSCNDNPDDGCTSSGAACTIKMNDGPEGVPTTTPGKCEGYGNACGTCQEECAAIELCGNGEDDDCNGTIDDGCALRACSGWIVCDPGQECR